MAGTAHAAEIDRDAALAERDALRAALARRDTTIAAVRALCEDLQVESVTGGRTDAGSLWPSEVLELLSTPVEAGAPAEPGYQRIADAIASACDTAALALDARRDGVPVAEPYLRLARVLDKAGLIDWAAFAGAPAEPTNDTAREDQP
jgi:hypothetical protein